MSNERYNTGNIILQGMYLDLRQFPEYEGPTRPLVDAVVFRPLNDNNPVLQECPTTITLPDELQAGKYKEYKDLLQAKTGVAKVHLAIVEQMLAKHIGQGRDLLERINYSLFGVD